MDFKNIPDIDKATFVSEIETARKTGDFSGGNLGEMVSNIVKKVIAKEFNSYTEDWILELYSEGVFRIMDAISKDSISMKDAFTYCYTTAKNSMMHAVEKLKKNIPEEIITEIESDPFYIRNKRRLLKGAFDKQFDDIVEKVSRKQPLLRNAVGISARSFSESLSSNELDNLIAAARGARAYNG